MFVWIMAIVETPSMLEKVRTHGSRLYMQHRKLFDLLLYVGCVVCRLWWVQPCNKTTKVECLIQYIGIRTVYINIAWTRNNSHIYKSNNELTTFNLANTKSTQTMCIPIVYNKILLRLRDWSTRPSLINLLGIPI